jgi:hypothetical protein
MSSIISLRRVGVGVETLKMIRFVIEQCLNLPKTCGYRDGHKVTRPLVIVDNIWAVVKMGNGG